MNPTINEKYQAILDQFLLSESKIADTKSKIKFLEISKQQKQKDKTELEATIELGRQSYSYIREFRDLVLHKATGLIEGYINKALHLLYGPELSYVCELEEKNECVNITHKLLTNGVQYNIEDANGLGVRAVIDIIALIVFRKILNIKAPLVLDESHTYLNGKLLTSFMNLLVEVSRDMGVQIIMVGKPVEDVEGINEIKVRKKGEASIIC